MVKVVRAPETQGTLLTQLMPYTQLSPLFLYILTYLKLSLKEQ